MRARERGSLLPVTSLGPYQPVRESVRLLPCPECGAVAGQVCINRKTREAALEQHRVRYAPLQEAHDAGFAYAAEQYEGLRARGRTRHAGRL